MLSSAYISLLHELEATYPVHRWTVNGLHVWPLLRIHAYFPACFPASAGIGTLPRARRLGRMLAREGLALLSNATVRLADPAATQDLSREVDAVFLSDGISFIRRPNGWFERFCDPLRERLTATGRTHAMASLGRARWPRAHPSRYLSTALRWAVLRQPAVRLDPATLPGFPEVAARLATVVGWRPNHRWLATHVRRVTAYSRHFGSILDRVQPRAVFLVSYYGDEGFGLCVACRERGLPSVDVQHGVQGGLHPAYGGWRAVPSQGYAMLPERFWVWSDEEAAAIRAWNHICLPHHQVAVTGNTMLDQALAGADPAVAAARETLRRVAPGKRRLLITLQPGFDTPSYYTLLNRVIADLPAGFGAWLRIHPMMLGDLAAIAGRFSSVAGRIEIVNASQNPLYAVLAESDVHLTHSSSTVLEAESFGIGSVLFDAYGTELFPRQMASGRAVLATEPEAIVHTVSSLAQAGSPCDQVQQATTRLAGLDRHLDQLLSASKPRRPA